MKNITNENEKNNEVNEEQKKDDNVSCENIENSNAQQSAKSTSTTSKKVRHTIGKILCYTVIISLVIIIVRAVVYQRYDVFGYRGYVLVSGSMEPTMKILDAVIVKEVPEAYENDVIAFTDGLNDAITVHRIIKKYTEGDKILYQTKGDHNNAPDTQLVKGENVKGVAVCTIPKIGYVLRFVQQYFAIIILIVGIIIIAILVRRLI